MTEPIYNRRLIKRECSKQLQMAGFGRPEYNYHATDPYGCTLIIPLALLDDHGNLSVAIRIRKPRKRQKKATSKRSKNISETTGGYVLEVHSMSEAFDLPGRINKLFTKD